MGAAGLSAGARAPARVDGYAPIGDYGAIGDGRGTALVARDGAIDWLCWPAHDSGGVFGALLDADRGGSFVLRPAAGFEAEQRYLEGTNVLETTFRCGSGVVRVTDAVTTDGGRLLPWHELVRRVDCLSGTVPVRWSILPRFGYGTSAAEIEHVDDSLTIIGSAAGRLGVLAWGAGAVARSSEAVSGEVTMREGERATLALVYAPAGEPTAIPRREEVEDRLERTAAAWREWLRAHDYTGAWRSQVERSLLALRLLTAPSGAIVAAATTSLPERIGGERNYDYRHAWPRDIAFTLDALLHCRLREPTHGSFAWLLRALQDTHPQVRPVYRISGEVLDHEIELPLAGYRGSAPVRDGNDAAGQLQLGAYGDLLHTAWLYTRLGNRLGPEVGVMLGENVDLLCEIWRNEDSSIWELPQRAHYTVSKMGSWLAFERALQLADHGQMPDGRSSRWRTERDAVAQWVERNCWSERRRSYTQVAGGDALDAACVLLGRIGYDEVAGRRFAATVDAARAELMSGPYAYRYSGMDGEEGAFVACSFWIAEALARLDRADEAAELMEEALGLGNHLGLMSEEVDPAGGELLGNFPQGLSHLSLVNAAATIDELC